IANYGPSDLKEDVTWTLRQGGKTLLSGVIEDQEMATGCNSLLTERIQADLSGVEAPAQLTLEVALDGTPWHNSWNIWVYPAGEEDDPGEVTLARTLQEALPVLQEGGTVLLSPDPRTVAGEYGKFVPVFWSPVFFPREAGTMGLLCDPDHPALARFPTAMHSDWQWWFLTRHSAAVNLDAMPQVASIIDAVDNFTQNRRLSYVFEAECESGRLLLSTMDLLGEDAASRPEVQQLRRSLLEYMNSTAFSPSGRLGVGELESLFR
ncbi:MAG: glycoside hydrolase family 2, partial [Bacteroidales bacterium]|nr:glycoside hydrolase family 2 [Bacteroidales bacterium]